MRHFHKQKNHYHCPIINLDKLWTLLGEDKRLECAKDAGKAPVIDLTDHGIFKVTPRHANHVTAQRITPRHTARAGQADDAGIALPAPIFYYTLYRIPYTLYPIPYTLYPIPFTLYPIPYTLYPIP